MLTILASSFLTATRQEAENRRRETARNANPLRNVRAGGLTLAPAASSGGDARRAFTSAPKAPRAGR